jgi:hypothetical protein
MESGRCWLRGDEVITIRTTFADKTRGAKWVDMILLTAISAVRRSPFLDRSTRSLDIFFERLS